MNISTTTKATLFIAATTLTFLSAGCCNDGDANAKTESTPETTTSAKSGEAPAAPEPAKAAAGDVTASKVLKPLDEWQIDDVKAALEKSGWKITGSTQTKSSMLSIVVNATRGETKAKINYYKNGGPFWKKGLAKDKAAIHEEGDVILGVLIEGDEQASKKLLDSLIGK